VPCLRVCKRLFAVTIQVAVGCTRLSAVTKQVAKNALYLNEILHRKPRGFPLVRGRVLYKQTFNAAFTLNDFDDQERNLTFMKTDFQVLKLKFYACNFKQAFYPLHKL